MQPQLRAGIVVLLDLMLHSTWKLKKKLSLQWNCTSLKTSVASTSCHHLCYPKIEGKFYESFILQEYCKHCASVSRATDGGMIYLACLHSEEVKSHRQHHNPNPSSGTLLRADLKL